MCSFLVLMSSILNYNVEDNKNKEKNTEGEGVSRLLTGTVCSAGMNVKCLEYSSIPLKHIPSEHISNIIRAVYQKFYPVEVSLQLVQDVTVTLKSSTLCVR